MIGKTKDPSFPGMVSQIVGDEASMVAIGLASPLPTGQTLALVGFDTPWEGPEPDQFGIPIKDMWPPLSVLSLRSEVMIRQIDAHPDALFMLAALDTAGQVPWEDSMVGVSHFLGSRDGASVVVSVPQHALTRTEHVAFRQALSIHRVTDIVFTTHAAGFTALPQVLIRIDSAEAGETARCRVARLQRDARSRSRLALQLARARLGDEIDGPPEFQTVDLPAPDEVWDQRRLDGRREHLLSLAASQEGVRILKDVASIQMARPPGAVGEPAPVLLARDVRKVLPALSDLEQQPVSERAIRLAPGDVVGKTMSPVTWAAVPDELAGCVAGNGVVVLSPSPGTHPRALAAYLNSPTANVMNQPVGTTIQKLRLGDLASLPVPDLSGLEVTDAASDLLIEIDTATNDLRAIADELETLRDDAFRTMRGDSIADAIRAAADRARLLRGQLDRQDDAGRAFQDIYPHPISRALRQFRQEQDPFARHAAMVRLVESIVITLGAMATGWASTLTADAGPVPKIQQLVDAWSRQGPSLGHWLGVVEGVGDYARGAAVDAMGLAEATARGKRGSGLLDDLQQLVSWRNRTSHGGSPRSPAAAREVVNEVEVVAEAALEGCSFLTAARWVAVDRMDYRSGSAQFEIAGRSLAGDHPDFELVQLRSNVPVESGRIHVNHGSELVPLHPVVSLRVCPTCEHEEIHFVERLAKGVVTYKSFTTGHAQKSDDGVDELEQRLGRNS